MKKLTSMILALALCLGLCSCGGTGIPQDTAETQKATEPKTWTVDTKYVIGTVAEFMTTDDYHKMVSDFEAAFHDATATLIVRKPYVEAAIEFYMDDPACHLLILRLQGDFGYSNGHFDRLTLIYDMDSCFFYDPVNYSNPEQDEKYRPFEEKPQTALLHIPDEVYTNLQEGDILWTELERYQMLTAEELATVNKALGVEKPAEGILYEPLPTEPPTEPPTEAPAEAPVETPVENIPVDAPVADAPAVQSGEVSVSEQYLADAARNFQSSKRYQEVAGDPSNIHIVAAFEYAMPDFQGYDVHVLVVRVNNVDTDLWGFSADTFLVDIATGNIWHEGNLDVDNWGDFANLEHAFACIISTTVWEQQQIWSDGEVRTDLPQSMIDAANASLT